MLFLIGSFNISASASRSRLVWPQLAPINHNMLAELKTFEVISHIKIFKLINSKIKLGEL